MSLSHCPECHREVAGGLAACQRDFEALQARELAAPSSYATHRLMVDAYSLQHPERYCLSVKSYAAHLTGMLAAMEHAGKPEVLRTFQRWLSNAPKLDKPPLPDERGDVTLAFVLAATDRVTMDRAIHAWAASAWQAYAPWHASPRA